MNLRCIYCQTPFTLGMAEKVAALRKMHEENLSHYDAMCPHCRKANPISRERLEMFTPGWQEAISMPAGQAQAGSEAPKPAMPAPTQLPATAPMAAPRPMMAPSAAPKPAAPAAVKPAAKPKPKPKAKPKKAKPAAKKKAAAKKKPAAKKKAAKAKPKKKAARSKRK